MVQCFKILMLLWKHEKELAWWQDFNEECYADLLPAGTALLEVVIFHLFCSMFQRWFQHPMKTGSLPLFMSSQGRLLLVWRSGPWVPTTWTRPSLVRRRICMLSVQRTVIWLGKKQESVGDVPCGNSNTVAMIMVSISSSRRILHSIMRRRLMHAQSEQGSSVSPVVRVDVRCKVVSDLPNQASWRFEASGKVWEIRFLLLFLLFSEFETKSSAASYMCGCHTGRLCEFIHAFSCARWRHKAEIISVVTLFLNQQMLFKCFSLLNFLT